MEITKDEALALLCAIDKRVQPALRDAKDEARAALMDAYAEDGTDRRAILVGGEKVGEVGVSYGKAAPYIYGERTAEALEWLMERDLVDIAPAKGWESHFELIDGAVVFRETGEVVDWAGWSPRAAKAASVRGCRPEDVARAFGGRLRGVDAYALIEGAVA